MPFNKIPIGEPATFPGGTFNTLVEKVEQLDRLLKRFGSDPQPSELSPRYKWRNDSGEDAPAGAIVRPTGAMSVDNEAGFIGQKPDNTTPTFYLVSIGPVAAGAVGDCTIFEPVRANCNLSGGTPAFGFAYGPTNGQWYLSRNQPGFDCMGYATGSGTNGRALFVQSRMTSIVGKGSIAGATGVGGATLTPGSGTITIWTRNTLGQYVASTRTVTGYNLSPSRIGAYGLTRYTMTGGRYVAQREQVVVRATSATIDGTTKCWAGAIQVHPTSPQTDFSANRFTDGDTCWLLWQDPKLGSISAGTTGLLDTGVVHLGTIVGDIGGVPVVLVEIDKNYIYHVTISSVILPGAGGLVTLPGSLGTQTAINWSNTESLLPLDKATVYLDEAQQIFYLIKSGVTLYAAEVIEGAVYSNFTDNDSKGSMKIFRAYRGPWPKDQFGSPFVTIDCANFKRDIKAKPTQKNYLFKGSYGCCCRAELDLEASFAYGAEIGIGFYPIYRFDWVECPPGSVDGGQPPTVPAGIAAAAGGFDSGAMSAAGVI